MQNRKNAVIAGYVGNVIEWYDFALYGFMASILSQLFFPSDNEVASLLATYGVFAAGFVMRPLGSFVFGWLGDTIGRSKTMLLSVALMFLPTLFLGLLPSYAVIGIWAPILLVIIRLVQGLSVGGEFSSSVTYLVETADPDHRGRAGSWANQGAISGMLLGAGLAALVTTVFPKEVVLEWAWRIPFLLGGFLGGIAMYLRRKLPKSPEFKSYSDQAEPRSPLKLAFTRNGKQMAQAILFASAYGVFFYIPMVYLPNWLNEHASFGLDRAMQINSLALLVAAPLVYLSALIGDRYLLRTHWITLSFGLVALAAWPLFELMQAGSLVAATLGQVLFIAMLAIPLGSAPAIFVELFPPVDRLTGYSISYNLGVGVIGGATPMAATWLIQQTGNSLSVAGMLVVAGALGVLAMLWIDDSSREDICQPAGQKCPVQC
ncbi:MULTISPECIES: MFS transporter [Alcanivorax]|uniref:Major facilitator transporter n=1 Tax=Alcanivorax hongdengensis A-11-3 TaxID=1177179 RepID=L0W8G1_9GAMM|nr:MULTISPECIES: MFS transporter [Alcanivorax]EKF73211.1 major facilitator transporter [Alcanivorax hongdengensis A-11-3]MDF1638258.1 MFS transporter [Alcanivorax jadensis]